jgi:hypothetical protein
MVTGIPGILVQEIKCPGISFQWGFSGDAA